MRAYVTSRPWKAKVFSFFRIFLEHKTNLQAFTTSGTLLEIDLGRTTETGLEMVIRKQDALRPWRKSRSHNFYNKYILIIIAHLYKTKNYGRFKYHEPRDLNTQVWDAYADLIPSIHVSIWLKLRENHFGVRGGMYLRVCQF